MMVKDLRPIDGKIVDLTEAASIMNDKNRQLNEATRLALMVSRVQRAIGNRFDQRIALGALYICVAKIMNYSPPEKHGVFLQDMMNGVSMALWNLYPPEVQKAAIMRQQEAMQGTPVADALPEPVQDNLKAVVAPDDPKSS